MFQPAEHQRAAILQLIVAPGGRIPGAASRLSLLFDVTHDAIPILSIMNAINAKCQPLAADVGKYDSTLEANTSGSSGLFK